MISMSVSETHCIRIFYSVFLEFHVSRLKNNCGNIKQFSTPYLKCYYYILLVCVLDCVLNSVCPVKTYLPYVCPCVCVHTHTQRSWPWALWVDHQQTGNQCWQQPWRGHFELADVHCREDEHHSEVSSNILSYILLLFKAIMQKTTTTRMNKSYTLHIM